MKNMIKVLLGSMALTFGGTASAGLVSNLVNNQPTSTVAENVETVNDQTNTNKGFYFGNNSVKLAKNVLGGKSSGFNFASLITMGIQKGGVNLLGCATSKLSRMAFKAILNQMGIDTRSTEQKALDNVQNELEGLKNDLQQGVKDIKRAFKHMENENILEDIYGKLDAIQTPVIGKMATMIDLANKEDDGKTPKVELEAEKTEFLEGLGQMSFAKLDNNKLWNQAERLAASISKPFGPESNLKLMDLYDDTYGQAETWDYMTIAPRRKFIGYVASMVNSLAYLAKIRASYEMSKLKNDDANISDYNIGLNAMTEAVTNLNNELKAELDKLDAIEKKHDVDHLITHRDAVVDNNGNISYKEGRTLSTKLFAVTTADNDDNYVSYTHDEKNTSALLNTGMGTKTQYFNNFIYTLDCTDNKDLYKTVFEDFNNYKKTVTENVTMKDYLLKAGFTCDNKNGFEKAKGFYSRIDSTTRDDSGIWSSEKHNDLRAYYYDFNKADDVKEVPGEISDAKSRRSNPFASYVTTYEKGDQADNYYLVFVNDNQKTISGKVVRTNVDRVLNDTAQSESYRYHFKGHKKWNKGVSNMVMIGK